MQHDPTEPRPQLDLFEEETLIDEDSIDSELARDARVRRIGLGVSIAIACFLGGTFLVNTVLRQSVSASLEQPAPHGVKGSGLPLPPLVLSRMKIRDTVYTTDSLYLDVNLSKQTVTVRFRDGSSRRFLISSGNPYIREGMSTPAGVFTVQNQVPMALSRQFNNARLHHWIGVQGGVGFHGLDGTGYYGNLGVRPSSHGCIRMSREEIAQMYNLVHPGAIILVHYGNPARVVGFCDAVDTVGAQVIDSAAVYDRQLGRDRLASLMDGTYWTAPTRRLVHLARQRFRWGMLVGDGARIPRQELPESPFLAEFIRHVPPVRTDRLGVRDDIALGRMDDTLRRIALKERITDSTERTTGMLGD